MKLTEEATVIRQSFFELPDSACVPAWFTPSSCESVAKFAYTLAVKWMLLVVLVAKNGFDMFWVYASTYFAFVMKFKTLPESCCLFNSRRIRSGERVSEQNHVGTACSPSDFELPVTLGIRGTSPQPAGVSFFDLGPKPIGKHSDILADQPLRCKRTNLLQLGALWQTYQ